MTCSTSFFSKTGLQGRRLTSLTSLVLSLLVLGCSWSGGRPPVAASDLRQAPDAAVSTGSGEGNSDLIAVLPLENLSGSPAPLRELRKLLLDRLRQKGIGVVEEEDLERFMARHRLRYVGGINQDQALAFSRELGARGVLISSLELYVDEGTPKIAMTSRLTGTDEGTPAILWMESVAMTGDDSPGLLDLGIIKKIEPLREKVLDRLAGSLSGYLAGRKTEKSTSPRRFRPKALYRSPLLGTDASFAIAVLPFVNQGERRNAGELMTLHFLRELHKRGNFQVIEPGVLREEMLRHRVLLPQGASMDTAELLFAKLKADLLLTGKVIEYQDFRGSEGVPTVWFSVQMIERQSREVVWASQSSNKGDEGVFFFDLGRIRTAHGLAVHMAGKVVDLLRSD